MTKLLVLSDSHGARGAIERILNKEQNNVDAVIFLGDGLRDLEQALAFFPHLRVYSVAGNCDYGALEPLDGFVHVEHEKRVVVLAHGWGEEGVDVRSGIERGLEAGQAGGQEG